MVRQMEIERYWKELVCGDNKGIKPQAILFFLKVLSWLYVLVIELKRRLIKQEGLGARVISVGNISLGGTGKTPMVIELAKLLSSRGWKVVVLSRGYKSQFEYQMAVVSDGNNILLDVSQAGDEPYLLARRLQSVPVIIGRNRLQSGRYAIERFGAQVLILDDGFQYWRLKREVDIALIDGSQPLAQGRLFPAGFYREPVRALKRAQIIVITHKHHPAIVDEIKGFHPKAAVLEALYKPVNLFNLPEQKEYPISEIKGKDILALSSIGQPESFETTIKALGARKIIPLPFPDHHPYSEPDMSQIESLAKGVDLIVTTEKDMVRLEQMVNLPSKLFVLKIELEMLPEDSLRNLLSKIIG